MTNTPKLDTFTRAYIDAALWSSRAYGSPQEAEQDPGHNGTFDSSFEYLNYDVDDLSPALLASVMEDCTAFQADQADDLAACETDSQAGHDFWLTRNGHGAGFWDRGLGAAGDRLTDAAHAYGESSWYVGDDGLIYA